MKNDDLPDGGLREESPTGAVREPRNKGRGRFDLIPPAPLRRLALHYERGARKYAERNWEKGLAFGSCHDSAMSHLLRFQEGDTSEDHLAAAAWNIFALMHYEEELRRGRLPKELDDRPAAYDPRVELAKEAVARLAQTPATALAPLERPSRFVRKVVEDAIGRPWEDAEPFFEMARAVEQSAKVLEVSK